MNKLNKEKLYELGFKRVGFESPSNIALIKYWGKKGTQLPINPSISYTLSKCYSRFEVFYKKKSSSEEKGLCEFYFEESLNEEFGKKSFKLLDIFKSDYPELKNYSLVFHSLNSFPHSSGIASSASSMSSLSMCLLQILEGTVDIKKASSYARLGSGSAARSIYGGLVSWGEIEQESKSSDNYSFCRSNEVPREMLDICDAIVIVSAGVKKVSSTKGHQLMDDHEYREIRIANAKSRYQKLIDAMKGIDFKGWGEIIEQEALELHALMMTSKESYMLMEPQTISVINTVRQFREKYDIPLYFTLDAGPNVHLLYPNKFTKEVESFLKSALKGHEIIFDCVGSGPKKWEHD